MESYVNEMLKHCQTIISKMFVNSCQFASWKTEQIGRQITDKYEINSSLQGDISRNPFNIASSSQIHFNKTILNSPCDWHLKKVIADCCVYFTQI